MEKVAPLELTPGETYYLEYKNYGWDKDKNNSYRAKGKFIDYVRNPREISAIFENVESVNDKPLYYIFLPNKIGQFSFHVAPNGCAMNIYKPINGLRQEAARRMINSQHINMNVPKFTIGAMSNISNNLPSSLVPKSAIVEGNWENDTPDSVYYHGPQKNSVGNDLAKKIGQYFGGRTRHKSRKTKSRKTKSRKTKSRKTKSRKTKSRRRR
jgi:hypothetical protein